MATINDFKGAFENLARPTLYRVTGLGADRSLEFMCKASQIPEATVGVIEVPFMGRKIKIPGDRTFAEWTLTVMNDEKYTLRKYFEQWMEKIGKSGDVFGAQSSEDIKEDGFVEQLAQDGSVIAKYKLIGCFPSNIAAQDLAFDSNDTISEFSVTLMYDYHTLDA